jgi:(E)-4-hydroxy-3-methylbut-2-enyl-diphosphate synthase
VIVRIPSLDDLGQAVGDLASHRMKDTPAEGLILAFREAADALRIPEALEKSPIAASFLVLDLAPSVAPADVEPLLSKAKGRIVLLRAFSGESGPDLALWAALARKFGHFLAVDASPDSYEALTGALGKLGDKGLIATWSGYTGTGTGHPVGAYRRIVQALRQAGSAAPVWIRNTARTAVRGDNSFLSRLIDASGLGDLVSIETEADPVRSTRLSYNVLQGAGARVSKAEFVACPSCGRTLFDLQTTTQRIRAQTGHLKGVKIAIMGCIVNGPGEMADADFGYVGGAPGKINLYVGKQCVQYNIPQAEADARLMALIKEHNKWTEPEPAHA